MDIVEQLKALANDASIRSVPKLLKTAASEGLRATKKQAEEALAERVPAQVLKPPPRSSGKVYAESPESRWAIDLIDFSQNTSRPGGKAYILVLMQVWSRKLWARAMKEKTWQATNEAMKKLLQEAHPSQEQTHDLLHDAGLEFSRISTVLPQGWVERTKDPLDRQGIASLDKAIQTLKVNLEDIIETKGGDWTTHLDQAVTAYNRAYNAAVNGPPSKAENGDVREFLINEKNAENMEHNNDLTKKRIASVQSTNHFREATGAKRAFHQQYGPKLHNEGVQPGGQYVKGSDEQLHLLKRVIPVHANSAEPQGKLVQPRQFKAETLRDLAEDIHAELINNPRRLEALQWQVDEKLHKLGEKIRTKAFVKKFSDLFSLQGDPPNEVVHALVISNARKPRVTQSRPVRVEPKAAPAADRATPSTEGGSSGSRDRPGTSRPPLSFWQNMSYTYGHYPPASDRR